MRMNLKNTNRTNKKSIRINIKNIKLNTKNLFIFLLSFSIVTILLGFIFYFLISSQDKEVINQVVINNFKIKESYNYLKLLKESIFQNTYNITLIWILGLSVIGVIAIIFIYFCEMFSIGFTMASVISTYKAKGLIGILIYLIPSKICYIIVLFLLSYFSIRISYRIIKLIFTKEEIKIKKDMQKYFKVLLFSFIVMVGVSMLEVFIDPIFIKLFTKL